VWFDLIFPDLGWGFVSVAGDQPVVVIPASEAQIALNWHAARRRLKNG
jgi:hypothetical protein